MLRTCSVNVWLAVEAVPLLLKKPRRPSRLQAGTREHQRSGSLSDRSEVGGWGAVLARGSSRPARHQGPECRAATAILPLGVHLSGNSTGERADASTGQLCMPPGAGAHAGRNQSPPQHIGKEERQKGPQHPQRSSWAGGAARSTPGVATHYPHTKRQERPLILRRARRPWWRHGREGRSFSRRVRRPAQPCSAQPCPALASLSASWTALGAELHQGGGSNRCKSCCLAASRQGPYCTHVAALSRTAPPAGERCCSA